jgi:FkbM family methyltransferase
MALAEAPGRRTLHLTQEPACSSLYRPDRRLTAAFPSLAVATESATVEIEVTTLDLWADTSKVRFLDFIKLDTQGSELDILRGAEKLLHTVRALEVEVEFNPIYEGQPLFADVDAFLRQRGFVLWRLSDMVHYSRRVAPEQQEDDCAHYDQVTVRGATYGGQLYWGHAHYVRKEIAERTVAGQHQRERDAALMAALGFWDLAQSLSCPESGGGHMSFISYAQNLEDVLLWRALQHVKDGFYIDVGASDPTEDSVTRAFYERGWHGINIEPLPAYHRRLCEDRPRDINLAVAAGADEGAAKLFDVPSVRGWASMDAAVAAAHEADGHEVAASTVPLRTLASICAEHCVNDIHFLKIDVEGSEAEVIRGMDLERWRPWILIVEAVAPILGVASYAEWDPVITAQGYRYAYFDGINRYYVAEEHDELRRELATQANYLDDYVSSREAAAVRAAQTAQSELAALRASTSWRISRHLRWMKRTASRCGGPGASDRYALRAFKRQAKLVVGHPARWLLARPHVGPIIDRQCARLPVVDRRVRAAVHEVNASTGMQSAPVSDETPSDLRRLPESAREVFADLQQTLDERGR